MLQPFLRLLALGRDPRVLLDLAPYVLSIKTAAAIDRVAAQSTQSKLVAARPVRSLRIQDLLFWEPDTEEPLALVRVCSVAFACAGSWTTILILAPCSAGTVTGEKSLQDLDLLFNLLHNTEHRLGSRNFAQ